MRINTGAFVSADTSKMKIWSNDVAKEVRPIYGLSPDVTVPEIGKPFRLHGLFRKYDNEREFKYSIALRNHECLVISVIEEGLVKVRINGRYTIKTLSATLGEPAEFAATPGGWFDFVVAIPADKPLPLIQVDLKYFFSEKLSYWSRRTQNLI